MVSDKSFYDMKKIFDVVLAFSSEKKYGSLLNVILTKMMDITRSDAGTLYILEDEKLHFRIVKNKTLKISQSVEETSYLPPVVLNRDCIENVSAYAAIKGEVVTIDDVYEDSRFNFAGPKHYDEITGYRTRSMLVLPLCSFWNEKTEVLGVIQLMNATDTSGKSVPYGELYDPSVILALANVASNTLANHIYHNEIRMLFHSFVSVMANAIDERSSFSSNHQNNVAGLCDAFALYLKKRFPEGQRYHFDDDHLEELSMAAILHDIGKIVTPPNIMDKADRLGERFPGVRYRFEIKKVQLENEMLRGDISQEEYSTLAEDLKGSLELIEQAAVAGFLNDEIFEKVKNLAKLTYKNALGDTVPLLDSRDMECLSVRRGTITDDERAIMQEHAAVTGRLLHNVAFSKYFKNVPDWACNHHEFLDGSGYPKGLKEADLPIEVNMITIIDIFEALTASDRPYKKAVPVEKSLNILREMVNEGKLHGELVELFAESKVWES